MHIIPVLSIASLAQIQNSKSSQTLDLLAALAIGCKDQEKQ